MPESHGRRLSTSFVLSGCTLVALVAAASVTWLSMGDEAQGQAVTPQEKSAALRTAPALNVDPSAGFYRVDQVRSRAEQVMRDVPFPPGRNRANELIWEHQGPLSEADVQALVQANAMCDWLGYANELAQAGHLTNEVRTILRDLPDWAGVRTLPFNAQLRAVAEAPAEQQAAKLAEIQAICKKPAKASRPQ
jgi:hypothetical protein